MTEEEIAKIKHNASTDGAIIRLKDGTKIYCETADQLKKILKTRKYADAAYVEYGKS